MVLVIHMKQVYSHVYTVLYAIYIQADNDTQLIMIDAVGVSRWRQPVGVLPKRSRRWHARECARASSYTAGQPGAWTDMVIKAAP